MPIKSFRGLLASGSQETIPLHTIDGSTGYRIVKFECMPDTPGTNQSEAVVKIYTIKQPDLGGGVFATNTIDFSSQTLIAAMYLASSNGSNEAYAEELHTVFDNIAFNQDIYITAIENAGGRATNWHVELEQVKFDLNENTVATLKDIRNIEAQDQAGPP